MRPHRIDWQPASARSDIVSSAAASPRPQALADSQFSLLSLLAFVTVCGVLSALAAVVGIAASGALMLLALSLLLRRGLLAVMILAAACLAADLAPGTTLERAGAESFARQSLVIVAAFILCGLYRLRGR